MTSGRKAVQELRRENEAFLVAKTFQPPSLTSAEVYFEDSDGHPRVIDFLTSPGGVDGREVIETAVPVTIAQRKRVARHR